MSDQKHLPSRSVFPAAVLACAVSLSSAGAAICFVPHSDSDERRSWAYEIGIAFITDNTVDDFAKGKFNIADGPAGGEVYVLTAAKRMGEFRWRIGNSTFTPQVELPLSLKIVDENGRSPFFDYNASVAVRWEQFPWNHVVHTGFSMGVGLSYSEKLYGMELQRHPDRSRSKVRFNWPIQMTFASPRYPDHQLKLFLAHHSWGRVFHKGGVNSLGFGYRRDF
jgi:hypothetical protein